MKDFKNLEVGEKFILGSKELVVAENNSCDGCAFEYMDFFCEDLVDEGYIPNCMRGKKIVIFKEVK